tara:strand:+ start:460 stop:1065 length:606 start_codon:yes stop_codon:yes gene_type:complete
MKPNKDNSRNNKFISDEVNSALELFNFKADELAEEAYKRKQKIENETFELRNGKTTSLYNESEKIKILIETKPRNHQPRFSQFFNELGRIANWSEEEKQSYHKPPIAAQTINEIVYGRFPKEVIQHIHSKNPYIKYCTRQHKNYYFLTDEGVILLERFIEDAVDLMRECHSVYEFRNRHFELYGVGFQTALFEKYMEYILF